MKLFNAIAAIFTVGAVSVVAIPNADAATNWPDTSMGQQCAQWEPEQRANNNWKKGKQRYDVCAGYAKAFGIAIGNRELKERTSRSSEEQTNSHARSPKPLGTSGRSCPSGTSYYKIRVGGLIKRTAAEGCFTEYQAAQLRMQANANQHW